MTNRKKASVEPCPAAMPENVPRKRGRDPRKMSSWLCLRARELEAPSCLPLGQRVGLCGAVPAPKCTEERHVLNKRRNSPRSAAE